MTQTMGRMIQPVRRPSVPVKSILVRRDLASTTRRCAARIRLHSAILIPTPQSSSSISFARSRESSARLSRCRALASSISINSIVPHPLQSLRLVNRLWPPLVPAVRERAAQASLWLAQFWNATGGASGWKGPSNEISQCPKQASGFGRTGCSGGAILKARSSMRRHSKARSARRRWVHHEDCKTEQVRALLEFSERSGAQAGATPRSD